MAIASHVLLDCDGFYVENAGRPLGWVEETWLGPDGEPAALALHLVDGRRGLLLARDVAQIEAERERILARDGASVLELGAPHLVADGSAAWETTGAVVEPPAEGTLLPQAVLALRPWKLRAPRSSEWHAFPLLLVGIGTLIALEILIAFVVAYLVTGHAT